MRTYFLLKLEIHKLHSFLFYAYSWLIRFIQYILGVSNVFKSMCICVYLIYRF